jgi:hypothetical protein
MSGTFVTTWTTPTEVQQALQNFMSEVKKEENKCSGWCNSRRSLHREEWEVGICGLIRAATERNTYGYLRRIERAEGCPKLINVYIVVVVCCIRFMIALREVRRKDLGYDELGQRRLQIDFDDDLDTELVDPTRVANLPIDGMIMNKWLAFCRDFMLKRDECTTTVVVRHIWMEKTSNKTPSIPEWTHDISEAL